MLELGKYATAVLSAYGSTVILVGGLVLISWRQSVKMRKALEAAEERRAKNG